MSDADASKQSQLLLELYDQLRAAAQRQMGAERASHTLSATALVHEAYLRIANHREVPIEERAHFYAAAVEAMRRVLLDHARARGRNKRGGERGRVSLDLAAPAALTEELCSDDLEALDAALARLQEHDARAAQVVRMRFYAGLGTDEVAALLGVSPRTVKSDFAFARAWLLRELQRRGT
ncbi:MAG: sigma-70 family RNA polymerase sigma factor [Planctomycetes bacterium]|nr:sigma-70 family RNA polymerase sigma factor [Planctomycetota bacterium]